LEDPDIDGRIILKCMFRSGMGWHALVWSDSGQKQVAGFCESRNGLSGSIKSGIFLYIYFSDRASSYNSGRWPTWRTISSITCLFESSTCFEQLRAHPQDAFVD
jgi:hypothetical protein